jgi:hypothetical protein
MISLIAGKVRSKKEEAKRKKEEVRRQLAHFQQHDWSYKKSGAAERRSIRAVIASLAVIPAITEPIVAIVFAVHLPQQRL